MNLDYEKKILNTVNNTNDYKNIIRKLNKMLRDLDVKLKADIEDEEILSKNNERKKMITKASHRKVKDIVYDTNLDDSYVYLIS